jgi:superfamily II RNA helicase
MNSAATLDLKQLFPFKLDNFQHKAIAALNAGKSVIVCAPTGSGKTLIGEYAIYRALARGKRVFYTTPLKALSNQKFRDFQERFGADNVTKVGLITGDILINADADVVVMTTEIFRNMLYETPIGQVGTSLDNLDAVVLDECHYLGDRVRGTVWEESIIYCPPQIQLLGLSATVGNPEELTDWISQIRNDRHSKKREFACELINSDFRPVPLRFFYCDRNNMYPLLDGKQEKLNPKLKALMPKSDGKPKRTKLKDCPGIIQVIKQLQAKDMLPAIYIIFSRQGCDRAVNQLDNAVLVSPEEAQQIESFLLHFFLDRNLELQQSVLEYFNQENATLTALLREYLANNQDAEIELANYLNNNPNQQYLLWEFLTTKSQIVRIEQVEPLLRGIASHHAGLLPAWKELVERLFELGLVKVVFATATLAAGINMPARTTVISALSKRTDAGHAMLTPSEFLQIAGRAGRRGKDKVGYVVTIQSPFEGAKEAAFLATSEAEPLRSRFTPSYGMVLNLLQKHSITEVKELLAKSFAEYLARKKLVPEQQAIAEITTQLAKLDVELAAVSAYNLASYQKLQERKKEEQRLLSILHQQAEANRKKALKPLIALVYPGRIVGLKGKHLQISSPLAAVVMAKIPASGKSENLVCLGIDNYWYIVASIDITEINEGSVDNSAIAQIALPTLNNPPLGQLQMGNEQTVILANQISNYLIPAPIAPEIQEQQLRLDAVQQQIDAHPLRKWDNPNRLLKKQQTRQALQEKLHRTQIKYQKQKSNQSYYWDEFLNLITVLQEFNALEGYNPTPLGKAAATIRGDNELWLALAFMSGELEILEPHHLAAAVAALISEPPRGDTWCEYPPAPEVLEVLGIKKRASEEEENFTSVLRQIRPHLFQVQHRNGVTFPIWREYELIGLAEQWALGIEWNELCENTNLAEGDIVRMLRRTIDVLWQIPQIPNISGTLLDNARDAISGMKRFPI